MERLALHARRALPLEKGELEGDQAHKSVRLSVPGFSLKQIPG